MNVRSGDEVLRPYATYIAVLGDLYFLNVFAIEHRSAALIVMNF